MNRWTTALGVSGVLAGYVAAGWLASPSRELNQMQSRKTPTGSAMTIPAETVRRPVAHVDTPSAERFDLWLDGRLTVMRREDLEEAIKITIKNSGTAIFVKLERIPHFALRTHLQAIALSELVKGNALTMAEFVEGGAGEPLPLTRRLSVLKEVIPILATDSLTTVFKQLEPLANQPYAVPLFNALVDSAPAEQSGSIFQALKESTFMSPIERSLQMDSVLKKWSEVDFPTAWLAATQEVPISHAQQKTLKRLIDIQLSKDATSGDAFVQALPAGPVKDYGLAKLVKSRKSP